MDLLKRCQTNRWHRIAFIGTAKHAGKTTALGGFLTQLTEAGEPTGLLSVGVDGERLDSILGVPKPRVHVETGTIVVSAEKALLESEAQFDWLETLPISSPLGPVMLAKVTLPGSVLLAGVRQRIHVEQTMGVLTKWGCRYVLVDGAFNRVAAASPELVDTAVLAVGAVTGPTVARVVEHARPVVSRFLLPQTDTAWQQLFAEFREAGTAAIAVETKQSTSEGLVVDTETHRSQSLAVQTEQHQGRGHAVDPAQLQSLQVHTVPAHDVMFGITRQPEWTEDVVAVYVPGAVTDNVVSPLISHPRPLQIVANHPVQVLLSGPAYQKLARAGHKLSVWRPMPLAAIAVNPHHIHGLDLPREELMCEIAKIAPGIPVYDALQLELLHPVALNYDKLQSGGSNFDALESKKLQLEGFNCDVRQELGGANDDGLG